MAEEMESSELSKKTAQVNDAKISKSERLVALIEMNLLYPSNKGTILPDLDCKELSSFTKDVSRVDGSFSEIDLEHEVLNKSRMFELWQKAVQNNRWDVGHRIFQAMPKNKYVAKPGLLILKSRVNETFRQIMLDSDMPFINYKKSMKNSTGFGIGTLDNSGASSSIHAAASLAAGTASSSNFGSPKTIGAKRPAETESELVPAAKNPKQSDEFARLTELINGIAQSNGRIETSVGVVNADVKKMDGKIEDVCKNVTQLQKDLAVANTSISTNRTTIAENKKKIHENWRDYQQDKENWEERMVKVENTIKEKNLEDFAAKLSELSRKVDAVKNYTADDIVSAYSVYCTDRNVCLNKIHKFKAQAKWRINVVDTKYQIEEDGKIKPNITELERLLRNRIEVTKWSAGSRSRKGVFHGHFPNNRANGKDDWLEELLNTRGNWAAKKIGIARQTPPEYDFYHTWLNWRTRNLIAGHDITKIGLTCLDLNDADKTRILLANPKALMTLDQSEISTENLLKIGLGTHFVTGGKVIEVPPSAKPTEEILARRRGFSWADIRKYDVGAQNGLFRNEVAQARENA